MYRNNKDKEDTAMVATTVLAKVDGKRLQKAVEGLVGGAYEVKVTRHSEGEVRGFVKNGDGKEYGVALTEGESFCSCKDSLYRGIACKHSVALALYVIRNPQGEHKPDLRLAKVKTTEEQEREGFYY
jgi:uncharacterized Zn finger protein